LDGTTLDRSDDPGMPAVPPTDGTTSDAEEIDRIRAMPKEVGVLLIVAGISGLILPGPFGTPFLILGGVVLWPRVFERVEIGFEKRFPKAHHESVRLIKRFLTDLDRRYPLPR
jgi:hypothetical protein